MYDLDALFTYHQPRPEDMGKYALIRHQAKLLAEKFSELKEGREKSIAFTHLENAVMWANASISRSGAKEDREQNKINRVIPKELGQENE